MSTPLSENWLLFASSRSVLCVQASCGHDATPYLLDRVQQATEGRSLDVNVAVYENNVALAGAIARALAG